MRVALVIVASVVLAGCGKKESSSVSPSSGSSSSSPSSPGTPSAPAKAWTPISGGKEVRWAGVAADVPAGWATQAQGDVTMLAPPGANQTSIDELYSFMGAPTLKSLDTPGLNEYLDQSLVQLLQVPVQRQGEPKKMKIGALDGRTWTWTATLLDGRKADIRCWAFEGSYVGSLVAVATTEALKKRMPELEQILASVHRPAAAAITASTLCTTWVRAFGEHTALTGNSNEQRLTFAPNGTFHYHSEGTSHGIFHTGSSQTDLDGAWKLNGDQLSGAIVGGETKTFTLEARTEAGTGAAVIAIDGTEFRQAEGRGW
ncbi:MAG: hypothetical protein K8T20_14235 [Planctomycetes bacterium]|nr:hypothetical protein [Planctomycetota bacterium]